MANDFVAGRSTTHLEFSESLLSPQILRLRQTVPKSGRLAQRFQNVIFLKTPIFHPGKIAVGDVCPFCGYVSCVFTKPSKLRVIEYQGCSTSTRPNVCIFSCRQPLPGSLPHLPPPNLPQPLSPHFEVAHVFFDFFLRECTKEVIALSFGCLPFLGEWKVYRGPTEVAKWPCPSKFVIFFPGTNFGYFNSQYENLVMVCDCCSGLNVCQPPFHTETQAHVLALFFHHRIFEFFSSPPGFRYFSLPLAHGAQERRH